jgi:glucosamine-6-phosphate deaminase
MQLNLFSAVKLSSIYYRIFAACKARRFLRQLYAKLTASIQFLMITTSITQKKKGAIMQKFIYRTKEEMGTAAAAQAAVAIKSAIKSKAAANIILATGTSQIETLNNLVQAGGIDWSKVTMFHLDEYIGLGVGRPALRAGQDQSRLRRPALDQARLRRAEHPASFRKYLKERFVNKVGTLRAAHFVNGDTKNAKRECQRLGDIIARRPIDVALIGIGENGHLAFNDPPADFETEEAFIIVELDDRCRRQQLGEGWFETLEQVPLRAISMSIRQITKSACIIVSAPEKRKAEALKNALEGPVTNMCPASILQQHKNCKIFMDEDAASLLSANV